MSLLSVGAVPARSSSGASLSAAAASRGATAPLSDAEQRTVDQLKARDRVVRAHEMAHMAAGAGLITHGASFTYQTGPDGRRYAVGGEVGIDVSPGRNPAETLAKAERIRAAALAPAEPSGQDRQVASEADRMAVEARMAIGAGEGDGATAGDAGASQATPAQDLGRRYAAAAGGTAPRGNRIDTYA